jgi:hypothetical protein
VYVYKTQGFVLQNGEYLSGRVLFYRKRGSFSKKGFEAAGFCFSKRELCDL